MGLLSFWKKPKPAAPVEMVAQALTLGLGQDPVAYARFRLEQIAAHLSRGDAVDRFRAEAQQETFMLIHTLRLNGVHDYLAERQYLRNVGYNPEADA